MRSRLIFALLLAAVAFYACGPRSRSAEPASRTRPVSGRTVATSLDVRVADEVSFALHVTNNASTSLELVFPSGQTHEVVVLDSIGREVWKWSEGRMFTQAMQSRILGASETLSYQAAWRPESAHGSFVAVASLISQNHPLEQRVPFSLP